VIRRGEEADAEAIEAVIRRAWRREGLDEPEVRVERWRERLRSAQAEVLVWDQGGSVAGVVSAGASDDEASPLDHGLLRALYVDPPAQGAGVGSALFDAAIEHLRASGFRGVDLWVLADNEQARAFYERRGFAVAGEGVDPGTGLRELRYRRSL
jgi:ribosomal protein S18 acetylase RimI-like enzyme